MITEDHDTSQCSLSPHYSILQDSEPEKRSEICPHLTDQNPSEPRCCSISKLAIGWYIRGPDTNYTTYRKPLFFWCLRGFIEEVELEREPLRIFQRWIKKCRQLEGREPDTERWEWTLHFRVRWIVELLTRKWALWRPMEDQVLEEPGLCRVVEPNTGFEMWSVRQWRVP